MSIWKLQLAADVLRGGLALELVAGKRVVAEVFRCDASHSVHVSTLGNDIPLEVLEWFLAQARAGLGPFDDGTPLPREAEI